MFPSGISDEVRSFILTYIESIGELEVLLLLQSDPRAEWSATLVEAKLRSSDLASKAYLNSLHSKGLALKMNHTTPTYSFNTKNPNLTHVMDELTRLYPSYQVAIISLIYDKKTEHILSFSNAFKIRKT